MANCTWPGSASTRRCSKPASPGAQRRGNGQVAGHQLHRLGRGESRLGTLHPAQPRAGGGGELGERLRADNQAHFARIHAALAGYRAEGLFREMPDDCFASVVIGPAHDLARQWLAGRTRVALADCRELLAQVAWDSVRAA